MLVVFSSTFPYLPIYAQSQNQNQAQDDFFKDPKKGYFNQELVNYGSKDGLSSLNRTAEQVRIPRPGEGAKAESDLNKRASMPPVAPNFKKSNAPNTVPAPPAGESPTRESPTRIGRPGSPPAKPALQTKQAPAKPVPKTRPAQPVGAVAVPRLLNGQPGPAPAVKQSEAPPSPPPQPQPVKTSSTGSTDGYPAVGQLEELTFGVTRADSPIADRLTGLENAVFAHTYPDDSLFDRTERLKRTLLGESTAAGSAANPYYETDPNQPAWLDDPLAAQSEDQELAYLDELASRPENREAVPSNVIAEFVLELFNLERRKRNMPPLENDELIQKMADEQMADMQGRGAISHLDSQGANPDRRYTLLGGTNAITESLVSVNTADLGSSRITKAAAALMIKNMLKRQDDREALLAPESTHVATSMGATGDGTRIFGCTVIMTRRGVIHPVAEQVKVGEKIDVEGEVFQPYKFDRITVAWESLEDAPVAEDPGGDEALPYFPPLDYVAYREKSEKDYSKAITALKAVGLVAAIAGGMFVPPVALAAPLIIMAGPDPTEAKPQSDIPIHGGIKVHGNSFTGHVPLNNDSQEGLYYLTVWGTLGDGARPVAISRRIVIARNHDKDDDDDKDDKKDKSDSDEKIEYTKEGDGDKKIEANDADSDKDLEKDGG
ncbi:MAG: hypothetical protein KC777_05650, partial [Cyanobacteria bacterium HKST-UBA02]|nr:hypothetical protein [Cyanobacteria bacterium HKST-UBA02]